MYQNIIGIDIGKASFFVATHGNKEVIEYHNNQEGFSQFVKRYRATLKEGLVVLETTGGYEAALITHLQQAQYNVHRANTRKVKHFIRSYGQLGKSDTIDALALAKYGFERQAQLPLFVENPHMELVQLASRRQDLKQMLVQEKNRLKAPSMGNLTQSFKKIIAMLEKELKLINEEIKTICDKNPTFKKQLEVLKTIPGIGEITAVDLLVMMPELGTVNRRQIASLGGVAPHPNESGTKVGYRFTRGGRGIVKPILFMAAMSAGQSHSHLGDFYRKLVANGKKKMVALTALMRKILVIANAKMRDFYAECDSLQHS